MSNTKELSQIARLISDRVNELKGLKTQKEIANKAGYKNQNMISMIKQGDGKVSLDRVEDLADALEVDPKKLMILAMEQFYSPKLLGRMMKILGVEYHAVIAAEKEKVE